MPPIHVVIEGAAGLAVALDRLGPDAAGARWYTPSAYVLEYLSRQGRTVTSIEDGFSQEAVDRVGRFGFLVGRAIADLIDGHHASAVCDARLGYAVYPQFKRMLDPLLVRAVIFDRWMGCRSSSGGRVTVAGNTALSPVSFDFIRFQDTDTLYYQLCARSTWADVVELLPVPMDAASAPPHRRTRRLAEQLGTWIHIDPSVFAYKLWRRLLKGRRLRLPWTQPSIDVLFFQTNEQIREAFLTLLHRGASVQELFLSPAGRATGSDPMGTRNPLAAGSSSSHDPNVRAAVDSLADGSLHRAIVERFETLGREHGFWGPAFEAAGGIAAERLRQFLQKLVPFAVYTRSFLLPQNPNGAARRVLLTNGLSDPVERLCFQRADQHGVSVVVAQHGGAVGLTPLHRENVEIFDIMAAHAYLHRHENGRTLYAEALGSRMPVGDVIGSPQQVHRSRFRSVQRRLGRRVLQVPARERLLIYVAHMLQGVWLAIPRGHLDTPYYTWVRHLAYDVFPRVNATCVMKMYPRRRAEEPHPLSLCDDLAPNVRIAQDVDFRYLRNAADLIVTDIPYSAFGWALSANVPTVLVDTPKNPLLSEVVEQVDDSLFLVDALTDGWESRLIELVNSPDDEIQRRWAAKKAARERFLEYAVFGPPRHSARQIVDFVMNLPVRASGQCAGVSS